MEQKHFKSKPSLWMFHTGRLELIMLKWTDDWNKILSSDMAMASWQASECSQTKNLFILTRCKPQLLVCQTTLTQVLCVKLIEALGNCKAYLEEKDSYVFKSIEKTNSSFKQISCTFTIFIKATEVSNNFDLFLKATLTCPKRYCHP